MTDILWRTRNLNNYLNRMKIDIRGVFEASDYKLTLKIRIFNMADQNVKIYLIGMKIITRGVSKSLIANIFT